jgi:hypothetical protein
MKMLAHPFGEEAAAISAKPSPIDVFRARAEARCLLVANGLMDLQDAVDGLQEAAAAQGLSKQYGQDEIQWILSEVFGRWELRDDG